MESILPILGIVFLLAFLANKLNKKEEEPENHHYDDVVADMYKSQYKEEVYQEQNADKPDTLGLMFDILNQLGCQPHSNEDGSLSVQYQGENFRMEFGGMYARVWDPMWSGVKADDPELPKVREAVNAANFSFGPTVVFTEPNEDGIIGIHSRRDIMLHPACPDNVHFVKEVLGSFFDIKQQVLKSFHQINADSRWMVAQMKRRPVGFKTHSTNDE